MREVASKELISFTPTKKEALSASKGSEIEVCRNNVWYCAVLEENLVPWKRLSVRHLKPQLKEDYSPPLFTTTFDHLIRPVPPRFQGIITYEEGDVIDAAHKGGWYSGWVIKDLKNQHFSVYLESDPDIFKFETKDLRPHLEWKDQEWFRCKKHQLLKSDFSAGKSVEVRIEVEPIGDIWAPAIAIKNNVDKTLMVKLRKSLRGEENKLSLPYYKIRPSQPYFEGAFKYIEKVDALLESGWCGGIVTKVAGGSKYIVSFGKNKQSKTFYDFQVRPSMRWKDGVWQTEEKQQLNENTPVASQQEIAAATATPLTTSTRKKAKAMKNQKGSVGQKAPEEPSKRDRVDKRKTEFVGVAGSVTKAVKIEMTDDGSPRQSGFGTHNDPMLNFGVETPPPVKDSSMVLPFIKTSPCWKVLESMEIYKAVPQSPHFSPLLECDEDSREGEAIGAMVMFTGLLEKLNNIQVNDPINRIIKMNENFMKLEKHGFNVALPRSRICKILSVKESQKRSLEELEVVKRDKDNKRRKCEEEVTKKIVELQGQLSLLKEEKVTMEKEIAQMELHEDVLDQKIQNGEQEFRAVVSAPWN